MLKLGLRLTDTYTPKTGVPANAVTFGGKYVTFGGKYVTFAGRS